MRRKHVSKKVDVAHYKITKCHRVSVAIPSAQNLYIINR